MKVTGVILAGGKSSRMGQDKGLMLLDEKPMIKYVIDALDPVVDELIIIANQDGYEVFGLPVYADLITNKGPLAGICAGLHYANFDTCVVLSCDTPFVSVELLSFLIKASKGFEVTVPENMNRTHQLISVISKSCEKMLEKEVQNEQLKAITAFEKLNLNIVNADQFDEKLFKNINRQSDVKN